ncbi:MULTISPECIES: hypothetical protein [Moorena]|uniref:hypothetical protein n=1 Tax=Moorena TaxID=1155738 RepID=UPI0010548B67|nr:MULTISPECIES: hypothetical protein [Moorena]NEQ15939.1 hypothetical protein [Moorena sp. SIO3E2]NEP35953.1 hypothetical protein [Moorena sp. SIO3B2]NEP64408.1 hypothetical protein [Moorena sp. SIO3A5]NEQ09538.1 hypothetical protein [Moorena sp. SIO4E2]NER88739.1 hypothetical protein [Moorena sp. SIO3A2]
MSRDTNWLFETAMDNPELAPSVVELLFLEEIKYNVRDSSILKHDYHLTNLRQVYVDTLRSKDPGQDSSYQ